MSLSDDRLRDLHHPPIHQKLQLLRQDVAYLKAKFAAAADDKIENYCPADRDRALNAQVDELVRDYLSKIFDYSRHTLVVDGQDGASPALDALMANIAATEDDAEQYEPFNFELNDQVRELYAQIDEETVKVTQLRKTVPLQATAEYVAELGKLEDAHQAEVAAAAAADPAAEPAAVDHLVPRAADMARDFADLVEMMKELKKTVPASSSMLDRAEMALDHLNKA
ncbi:kinetochore protein Mis14 like-domain-containing protein [Dipodascopsis tothii]|uniref:kinetochore protein Mis14 like-domain-containing protein n=1 Tax=Dipodascopsis tothii TaxID=44089 RepID=UPI0034CE947F